MKRKIHLKKRNKFNLKTYPKKLKTDFVIKICKRLKYLTKTLF